MFASCKNIILVLVLAMIAFCSIAVDSAPAHSNAANGIGLVNVALNNLLSSCSINQNTRNYYPYWY